MKELLEKYNDFLAEIKTKKHEIKKLELEEVTISGSNFSVNGGIRPTGFMTSNIANKVINNMDKINKLNKEIEELQAKIDMINSILNTLNDYHKQIIELKYKYNKNDAQISKILEKEERTIRYASDKALDILEKKYSYFLEIS